MKKMDWEAIGLLHGLSEQDKKTITPLFDTIYEYLIENDVEVCVDSKIIEDQFYKCGDVSIDMIKNFIFFKRALGEIGRLSPMLYAIARMIVCRNPSKQITLDGIVKHIGRTQQSFFVILQDKVGMNLLTEADLSELDLGSEFCALVSETY